MLNNKIIDADFFIIPNRTWTPSNDFLSRMPLYEELYKANNLEMNPDNSRNVAVWITIPQLKVDNFQCHGYNDTENHCKVIPTLGCIPYELIKNVKEGDTVKVTIPCKFENHFPCKYHIITKNVIFNLTAAQTKYRYSRFGKFEHVINCI